MTASSFAAFLEAARTHIDEALERYLPTPPDCPAILSEAMRYSVFAGGKRFRPILTLSVADAVARRDAPSSSGREWLPVVDSALPSACAIELIHTYSLIHDDLPAMDNDMLRRGRPTLHVVYGDGIAVLAGDSLHAEAFALLAREPRSTDAQVAARKLHVIRVIGDAVRSIGMMGGQAIDLQASGQTPGGRIALDADGLRAMHAKKTGALIRACATSGAIMAGASDELTGAVDRYGAELGLAFQIIDDILDVEGASADLGKTAGKDAAGEKPTYPALFGIDRSRTLAAECVARARDAVEGARLTDGWLITIADWILHRRN